MSHTNKIKAAMEQYEAVKAKFIEASRKVHLDDNQYEPHFIIAADCVRKVFKVEPVHNGYRRGTLENQSTQCLTAIMKSQTDIIDGQLAKLLQKCDHSSVIYNMKKHYAWYDTDEHYRNRYNQVLANFIAERL